MSNNKKMNYKNIRKKVSSGELPTVYLLLQDIVNDFEFDEDGVLKLADGASLELGYDSTDETVSLYITNYFNTNLLIKTQDFVALNKFLTMLIELRDEI